MKDDLKRLLNEFLSDTIGARTEKVCTQLTNKMPKGFTYRVREATLTDLIDWLNDRDNE